VDFCVGAYREAGGVDDAHDVEGVGFSGWQNGASALDGDAQAFGEIGEKGFGVAVGIIGYCSIEGEAGVEEFGQDDEVARVDGRVGEERLDTGEVGGWVFPRDIQLDEMGVHEDEDIPSGRGRTGGCVNEYGMGTVRSSLVWRWIASRVET
jgi:hypothetical protein